MLRFLDSGPATRNRVHMSGDVVSVRLSGELASQLSELVERTHRSKAFYVREALSTHLEGISDYYLAAELSRQVASGELGVESWEDLRDEFGAERDPTRDEELLQRVQ